jgi:prepilin-type N-terminal cleavage/methylation domain-containing protein
MRTNNRGFTLAETVVALALLGIAMVATFSGLSQGLAINQQSRLTAGAQSWISGELESLRVRDWATLQQLAGEVTFHTPAPDGRLRGERVMTLRRPGQYRVDLTVAWEDGKGASHAIRLASLLNDQGLGKLP